MLVLIFFDTFDIGYFLVMFHAGCSMQHAPLTPPTYLRSYKKLLFCISVFGGEVSLIFPIIDLRVDLRSNLHIGVSDLVNPLIFVDSCPG